MARFSVIAAISLQAVLLSGCAYRTQVTHMAVEYNEFVAQATNRQTAINIIRARDREPLHFTSFAQIHGTATIEGNAGVTTAVGGLAKEKDLGAPDTLGKQALTATKNTFGATSWTPTLGIKVDTGTAFDIAINSTDDFWKGILNPVSSDTLVYYLRQGWPRDLLNYLFVEQVDYGVTVDGPDGKKQEIPLASYYNSPPDAKDMKDFEGMIRCLSLSAQLKPESPDKTIPVATLAQLNGISADVLAKVRQPSDSKAAAAPLAPAATKPPLEVATPASRGYRLALALDGADSTTCDAVDKTLFTALLDKLKDRALLAIAASKTRRARFIENIKQFPPVPVSGTSGALLSITSADRRKDTAGADTDADTDYCNGLLATGYSCHLTVAVSPRSIEGVIYYLGEYVRDDSEKPLLNDGHLCPDGAVPCVPIIRLYKRDKPVGGYPFIQIDYQGYYYEIPATGQRITMTAGRSSEVITLVQQILNQYRTAKDLPITPYVGVLN